MEVEEPSAVQKNRSPIRSPDDIRPGLCKKWWNKMEETSDDDEHNLRERKPEEVKIVIRENVT